MSEHVATVSWERNGQRFVDNRYSRVHTWRFDGGATVAASSSPSVVPLPLSAAENVDPEEAFVASLSSCHMLWFLSLAAKAGIVVESYVDEARGHLGKGPDGKLQMLEVILMPKVTTDGGGEIAADELHRLHEAAHDACFLASSVKCPVRVVSK